MIQQTQDPEQNSRWRRVGQRAVSLSLFEKVIVVNSVVLIGEALAGLWITSHSLESHHYLIDTSFLVIATLCSLSINILVLRASFRPLFRLLATMHAVSEGKTATRTTPSSDPDIGQLAQAFNEMLDRLEAIQHEQTMHILQAQEEERRRIARELHDETSQTLTALLIHNEILSQRLAAFSSTDIAPVARKQLDDGFHVFAALAQDTLDKIRILSQQLRPSVLDDLGLEAALRWLVEDGQERLHLTAHFQIQYESTTEQKIPLPPVYETTLFRIAQEGLTNSARHAHAQSVTLKLLYGVQSIRLTIEDDGCGFEQAHTQSGLGIRGMHERAVLLGGTLHLLTELGKGTSVEAILPLPASKKGLL